jgi:hypothetical protein
MTEPAREFRDGRKVASRLRLLAERFERGDWDRDFKDVPGDRMTRIIAIILRMIAAIEDEAGP